MRNATARSAWWGPGTCMAGSVHACAMAHLSIEDSAPITQAAAGGAGRKDWAKWIYATYGSA